MSTPRRSAGDGALPLPVDLAAVIVIGILSLVLILVPAVDLPVLSAIVGALLVFIAPGYALLAALFPAGDRGWSVNKESQFDGIERLVLGAGLSLAVTGLIVIALGLLSVPLVPVTVVGLIASLTIITAIAAVIRWRSLPASVRYHVDIRDWGSDVRTRLRAVRQRPLERSNLMVLVVIVSLAVATAGVGFAMTQRTTGETFTEFSLLTEGADGDLVADDYPTSFVAGESESLVVAVGNHEQQALSYTVVVALGTDDVQPIDTFSTGVIQPGATETFERQVTPERTGEDMRLSFLLYRGEPPSDPAPENAYRETHLWITVSE